MWLDEHSEAVESSLDHYYRADLRDWYRGRMTARWLWSRLFSLPMDSALALSVTESAEPAIDQGPAAPPESMPWPPIDLRAIPVASSMAQVGAMISGADLN